MAIVEACDSTKTKILLAAGPIFAKKGYRSATVREICEAAAVNLASVNYYFGDKQQLYVEAVMHARTMRVEQVPAPSWDADVSSEEKLHAYVRLLLDRVVALKSAPWQVRLLMREVLLPTDACRKLVHDYFRPFLHQIMSIIDEMVGFELPPEKRMQLAFSVVGQCMYYRFAGDLTAMLLKEEEIESHFSIAELADHITQFSISAIHGVAAGVSDPGPTIASQE